MDYLEILKKIWKIIPSLLAGSIATENKAIATKLNLLFNLLYAKYDIFTKFRMGYD